MKNSLKKALAEEQFAIQLATGKTIVIAMERSEKGHLLLQLAQQGRGSAADIFFGGNTRLGWQAVTAAQAAQAIETAGVGSSLEAIFGGKWGIQRIESREPFYDGQQPVINPTTGEIVQKHGSEYFLRFEVVRGEVQDVPVGATAEVAAKPEAKEALEG